ncbi:MAG: alpha/beta hydrolase [Alphaproteobacteria bacterium]|nr:alpha/beta hydrolase [Alphaproteobacteria bacterium]
MADRKPTGSAAAETADPGDLAIAKQGHFYVGGGYHETEGGGHVMAGQAHVEYQIPADETQPYPIVMIPGGNQSATCFTATPDGRDGWAQYFLRRGFAVYIIDQPGRGRSAHCADIQGGLRVSDAETISQRFCAPARHGLYPQAERHSQWPGDGIPGDPVFDAFYASHLPNLVSREVIQRHNQDAGAALLDRIGPAILLTHSQSGTFGWLIADARPGLVRAIVAVEPGCPVGFIEPKGPPDWFDHSGVERVWGLASIPLAYDPPADDPSELRFVLEDTPAGPELARCWLQAEPARALPNLAGLPVAVISGEASFHTPFDAGTARFLRQAGVDADYLPLAELGIRGNGHMMMLEKNSDEVAEVIVRWIAERAGAGA